jgi:hypothetical protein
MDEGWARADREFARFQSNMEKLQEKSDREFAEFREEMKKGQVELSMAMRLGQDKLSLEMKQGQVELSKVMEQGQVELSMAMKLGQDKLSLEMKQGQVELSKEMTNFKQEMADFKQEMADFKQEMKLWREKKDRDFEEMKEERRQHNLEMGRIANKHGLMAEDLVAPSICRIMKQALGIDKKIVCVDNVRVKRTLRGDTSRLREFDVVAECLDYVLVNETKSTLIPTDVDTLINTLGLFRDYFPEFRDRKLVGAVASLFIDPGIVNYATKRGIIALAVGEDLMDIQNPPGFKPAVW